MFSDDVSGLPERFMAEQQKCTCDCHIDVANFGWECVCDCNRPATSPISDDDLKRLKERVNYIWPHELVPILYRLKCAETMLEVFRNLRPEIEGLSYYKAWRKAAGKVE